MWTGRGLFHQHPEHRDDGNVLFLGQIHTRDETFTAGAIMNLEAHPLPTLQLVIGETPVEEVLEMNAAQQSRAEPDFMSFIILDGEKHAAGIWIPRKKVKKMWFLLIVRPTGRTQDSIEKPQALLAPDKSEQQKTNPAKRF